MPRRKRRKHRAFTLIELMVVVVMIGILATAVTLSVTGYLVSAKQNVARSEIATIRNALTLFYLQHDRYPSNEEGLMILTEKSPHHPDGILTHDLRDPWNHDYIYVYPGTHGVFDLVSYGADGAEGGIGADEDIASWSLDSKD